MTKKKKDEQIELVWDFETHMKNCGSKLLTRRGVAHHEVVDVEAVVIHGGYCETCAYETVGVEITYRVAPKGRSYVHEAEVPFHELMRM